MRLVCLPLPSDRKRTRSSVCSVLLLAAVASGCGDTVSVELAFPSEDTFIRAETGELHVVELESDEAGVCPQLLAEATLSPPSIDAAISTQPVSVCELRDGGLEVPDVSTGLAAFVAVARRNGQGILAGCTIRDVYKESGPLRIVLAPTDEYRSTFRRGTAPELCTAAEKCNRGCP